ncbi:MAG TPA: BMP family ABC transporter substrate-binding protein [Gammaproteobacteria bacterium]|jgi:simple sugar transport system substrate-binding protein|nr:BMP family ABC transporter substrate-binding protein [Arenicellales bacterium]HIG15089.1 BMP family ABC transporter substrate-binding protein [Gammaproteobacteria bacterium]
MKILHRVAVALFATLLSFGVSTSASADKTKVGFIYIGPPGDHGWTYAHDQARLEIEKELGDQVQTTFVEGVPEGPDAERAIAKLAQTGHKLIFTTSFGYMEPTLKAAKRFPDVKFEHATGYKRADNVATYSARFYEGRYVQGVIAGKVSKSGVIGYIASFPIPEVVRGINAFMLGAHTQNPNIKVKVVWVFSWYDPGKEADAAKVLMDQGADIITQHTDSTAALQAAADRGIHAFGQASDMIQFAPKTQLTAIIDAWGPYYVARTKALLDGSWKSQDTWDGMGAGMVVMAPFTNMPSDVAALAQKTYDDLRTGKLHAFSGPINDQSGKQVVAAGAVADDGMLAGMNFYIEGIDGELPK